MLLYILLCKYTKQTQHHVGMHLSTPGYPALLQFLFCLSSHTSQARSVLNHYCNFSSMLAAKVFSFICQLLFAFQVVMMIHDSDHGHYIYVLFILYTFPSFANANNHKAKRFFVVVRAIPFSLDCLLLRKYSLPFYFQIQHNLHELLLL